MYGMTFEIDISGVAILFVQVSLRTAIAAYPDRFAGFATLPTSDPEAAIALAR